METNNKLIAEFLGIQIEEGQERIYINGLGTELIEYTFNTDWNWLMKAVDKIESENFSIEMNKQEEGDYQCLITKGNDVILQTFSNTKIEATHKAVVEFIKW